MNKRLIINGLGEQMSRKMFLKSTLQAYKSP